VIQNSEHAENNLKQLQDKLSIPVAAFFRINIPVFFFGFNVQTTIKIQCKQTNKYTTTPLR
jgi:hypothetical protein